MLSIFALPAEKVYTVYWGTLLGLFQRRAYRLQAQRGSVSSVDASIS